MSVHGPNWLLGLLAALSHQFLPDYALVDLSKIGRFGYITDHEFAREIRRSF